MGDEGAGVVAVVAGVVVMAAGLVVVVATSGLGSTEDEGIVCGATAEPSAAATELAAAITTGFSLFANGFTVCRDS